MALFNFRRKKAETEPAQSLEAFLTGYSIEVMPRTAEKVESFRAILPKGTRVYIAHIESPIEEMVATAKRIVDAEGFDVMPHFPARIIKDKATLLGLGRPLQGRGASAKALLLGGGNPAAQVGDFSTSMQLIWKPALSPALTACMSRAIRRATRTSTPMARTACHRHGSRALEIGLHAERTDAQMAMATQFCFEAEPVIAWVNRLQAEGIKLPVHIGIAGPAKLQTLIKFAIACGVGPSLRVLAKARDGCDQAAPAL